ncbi:MAG: ROK family protein [Anaerolineales bacterium]|nr:ROK family protein [Anaerolineales bacterium]
MFGGIEGGGTKFNCIVGTSPDDIRREARFPTTTPNETLDETIRFFRQAEADFGRLSALGIACFGPLDVRPFDQTQGKPASPTFGFLLPTTKPHWSNVNILGKLKSAFDIPLAFDTDVNGAAFGEWTWGAAQGLDTFLYLTIGTGIGGGAMVNGKLLHGLLHPEMGHIRIPHDSQLDPFEGICPFHKDCFEGLASGPAIEARWGQKAESLPQDHPAWDLEGRYIALALSNFIVTFSPQRIILGGGVSTQGFLFPMIQQKVTEHLNGYVQSPSVTENISDFIVPPELGNRSGMLGAIALAKTAL